MKAKRAIPFFLSLVIASAAVMYGCSNSVNSNDNGGVSGDNPDWLVPVAEVFDGGPGKDGIPSVDAPQFIDVAAATFVPDDALVDAVRVGDEIRAYPHLILDWHEIVNDKIGTDAFALTYCPLTGSAIGWERTIGGTETTFGVSGLLYNTNLMPYDRKTNSTWSQMRNQCVNGALIGTDARTFQVLETTWQTFKEMYPTAKVMSTATGFNRPYGLYPYAFGGQDYRRDGFLLFPISIDDTRLPRKERIVGVTVNGKARAYRIGGFAPDTEVINDTFNGMPLVVVGSSGRNFGMIFGRKLPDGTVLTFTPVQNNPPAVMIDNEGTSWDLFGVGLSGPRAGEQLPATDSYIAFWFAWGVFNAGSEIYGM